jgi:hypothetical protein
VRLAGFTRRYDACEYAVLALGNIARKSSIYRDLLLESGVVAAILKVVSQTDIPMSLRGKVGRTISHLCFPKPPLATIAAAIPFLIEVSQSSDDGYAANAGMLGLRSITSDGDCDGIPAVIEHGALPVIMRRLSTTNNTIDIIDELALYCLGNIVESHERHIARQLSMALSLRCVKYGGSCGRPTISGPRRSSCASWRRSPPATWIISTRCCRPVPST